LPRILGSRYVGPPGKPGSEDDLWQERFGIVIKPHPDLAPTQQAIVAKDYGMADGTTVLEVRYAMLFYVLKRLGLLGRPDQQPARSQHIVVANRKETEAALKKADWFL
jgi:hypothetical protein